MISLCIADGQSDMLLTHVALGTFGLSRGLITKRGMAGRITSIIINAEFEPDERPYTGIYDFCIRCGACALKCPVKAISMEYGKNNARLAYPAKPRCRRWLYDKKDFKTSHMRGVYFI